MAKLGGILANIFETLIVGTYNTAEPVAQALGFDPFTVIALSAIAISIFIASLAGWKDDDEFKLAHGIGISGAIALHGFVTVDYMKRIKGVEASTYLGKLIGDISGTTVYLFVMFLILSYFTVKLEGKSDFMKELTGFGN